MKKRKKTVSFPHFGMYTPLFKDSLEKLGARVVLPPRITDRTVKIGTKYSSEMMCFPYKVTLGNFIETLEQEPDIDHLIMYDSGGMCRFRHYHILQSQTLESLGFRTKLLPLNIRNIFALHREITPLAGRADVIKTYLRLYAKTKELSKDVNMDKNRPNVAIIGEIYTCIEPSVNFNISKQIEDLGCNPINTVSLRSFINESLKSVFSQTRFRGEYHKRALRYLNGPLGGHGAENIANLLKYIDQGVNGVIWVRPLSCMPESTVDLVVKRICKKNNTPLLVFDIDESNFALNIATRLETFIEQIRTVNEERTLLSRV